MKFETLAGANQWICLLDANFCIHLQRGKLEIIFESFMKSFSLNVMIPKIVKDELEVKEFPPKILRMIDDKKITIGYLSKPIKSSSTENMGEEYAIALAQELMLQGNLVLIISTDNSACDKMSDRGIENIDLFDFIEFANRRSLLKKQQAVDSMGLIKKHGTLFDQDRLDCLYARLI